jgi:hypothetical protein
VQHDYAEHWQQHTTAQYQELKSALSSQSGGRVEHRTLVVVFEQALMPFLLTVRTRVVSSIKKVFKKKTF